MKYLIILLLILTGCINYDLSPRNIPECFFIERISENSNNILLLNESRNSINCRVYQYTILNYNTNLPNNWPVYIVIDGNRQGSYYENGFVVGLSYPQIRLLIDRQHGLPSYCSLDHNSYSVYLGLVYALNSSVEDRVTEVGRTRSNGETIRFRIQICENSRLDSLCFNSLEEQLTIRINYLYNTNSECGERNDLFAPNLGEY